MKSDDTQSSSVYPNMPLRSFSAADFIASFTSSYVVGLLTLELITHIKYNGDYDSMIQYYFYYTNFNENCIIHCCKLIFYRICIFCTRKTTLTRHPICHKNSDGDWETTTISPSTGMCLLFLYFRCLVSVQFACASWSLILLFKRIYPVTISTLTKYLWV